MASVFRSRESWSSGRGLSGEEFDARGMCCGALVAGAEEVRVATGSLSGVLRVYRPKVRDGGFQVDDLELEEQLAEPVLQLECGRFTSQPAHGNTLSLAVLHPRSLAVYDVISKGDALVLEPRYTHALGSNGAHFSACNMCMGPFGGVRGRDFIAVQSLDGQLHVFEQESFAFIRQLNHVLLPGPVTYVPKMDCVLAANSQFQVDCYKYHMLAATTAKSNSGATETKIQTDWTFTVGEQILDIVSARLSQALPAAQVDVFILAERSIYCLTERGQVRAHVKLEVGYNPMCCCTLPILGTDGVEAPSSIRNLMVANENGQITVYREFGMVWSASMRRHAPVVVTTARIDGVDGMIITMSDDGLVCASYLGTEPSAEIMAPRRAKVLPKSSKSKAGKGGTAENQGGAGLREEKDRRGSDGQENDESKGNGLSTAEELRAAEDMEYEVMDREHQVLLEKIRKLHRQGSSSSSSSSAALQAAGMTLAVKVWFPSTLDELSPQDNNLALSEDPERVYGYRPVLASDGSDTGVQSVVQMTAKVFVSLRGSGELRDVQVSVHLPEPFVCAQNTFSLPAVRGVSAGGSAPTPLSLALPIRCKAGEPISSFEGRVVCSFSNAGQRGARRMQQFPFRVPMSVGCRVRTSVKNDAVRITIDTNHEEPVRLAVLFDDMLRQPGMGRELVESVAGSSSNVVSFELFDGVSNVTVLASKSGGRYRVQGGCLAHLWLVADELVRRLSDKFGSGVTLGYADSLPLPGLHDAIQRHHSDRLELARAASDLNDRSQQYRLVQRRLLSRFKDKNAPPLRGLDKLLAATHEDVMNATGRLRAAKGKLRVASCELSACLCLVLLLCKLKFPSLSSGDMEALRANLFPNVSDCDGADMGWEELTDVAITHLLRTTLAKVPRAVPAGPTAQSTPAFAADASKVTKHISILFDRISKGARPGHGSLQNVFSNEE